MAHFQNMSVDNRVEESPYSAEKYTTHNRCLVKRARLFCSIWSVPEISVCYLFQNKDILTIGRIKQEYSQSRASCFTTKVQGSKHTSVHYQLTMCSK
jgi:hypothetical protein